MDKVEFGKTLKENRKEQGKTQCECAVAAGVCLEAYQKWERGLSYPRNDKLYKICDYLGVNVDD